MGSVEGGIVGTPVREASDQGLIIGTVVKIDQPLGGAAVLCLEHGEQGSDGTGAGGSGHESFRFDEISLQGQATLSERCSDGLPTGPCSGEGEPAS